jgi:hypothetical protein
MKERNLTILETGLIAGTRVALGADLRQIQQGSAARRRMGAALYRHSQYNSDCSGRYWEAFYF